MSSGSERLPGQGPSPGAERDAGASGRKVDPLYRIRKLLLAGDARLPDKGRNRLLLGLRLGDPPDAVLGAWLAKESVRDVYLTDDAKAAAILLDKAIAGCTGDVSSRRSAHSGTAGVLAC